MAPPELSSNWKKLQAKIKADSTAAESTTTTTSSFKPTTTSSSGGPGVKRKAAGSDSLSKEDSFSSQAPPAKRRAPPSAKLSKSAVVVTKSTSTPSTQKTQKKKTKKKVVQMGAADSKIDVTSTAVSKTGAPITASAPSASLSLWAAENDISAESIAEAYNLGLGTSTTSTSVFPSTLPSLSKSDLPNAGLLVSLASVGKYVSIDCEMVGVGPDGYSSALARVSVVDFHGRQVYDSFVRPRESVTDWRTHVSGVAPRHMATARSFEEVQTQISDLLSGVGLRDADLGAGGRILIGHDVKHDLQVLMLDHPSRLIRDTARYSGFRKYGHGPKPALRVLAREILRLEIHTGQHSSIEDARVAMLLFRKHKSGFDLEHANRFPDTTPNGPQGKRAQGGKKKKGRT
ncbi:ribonuclease H-like domain-containing protein [Diplogelasinospora grovesii]|uniref:RNA exonuclease 4 n=1 Tax=Diplogelasinospora grovesii TaxID=303347 RepID=A0AAN6S4X0_9PEZI|nr:ribonuclease H-like domain-containing protein [Diplogelasinospora grovesii]